MSGQDYDGSKQGKHAGCNTFKYGIAILKLELELSSKIGLPVSVQNHTAVVIMAWHELSKRKATSMHCLLRLRSGAAVRVLATGSGVLDSENAEKMRKMTRTSGAKPCDYDCDYDFSIGTRDFLMNILLQ